MEEPSAKPAHQPEDVESIQDRIEEHLSSADAGAFRRWLMHSKPELREHCKECDIESSGTKMCMALQLTAWGSSYHGSRRIKLRTVPELFWNELRYPGLRQEIEELERLQKSTLKEACRERKLQVSCNRIGCAVQLALYPERRHEFPHAEVDACSREGRAHSRPTGSRNATEGEDADAGLTEANSAFQSPFAHVTTVWSAAWVAGCVAATTGASWMYTIHELGRGGERWRERSHWRGCAGS